ncbi:ABC transporter substrate-binding protein [Haloarchaeobius sp. TZWWS8]|uniref:ABC transporter substrate-binding protein n=1 Tax=Haloarchaeobius sp. TZWWS8 TaxID=3446121 RepID=UPI003EBB802C
MVPDDGPVSGSRSRRETLKQIGGGLALATLAGCMGGDSSEQTSKGDSPTGGSASGGSSKLRAALVGSVNIRTFDPPNVSLDATMRALYGVYEGLTTYDENMGVQPQLATEWEKVDDTSIRFTLKEGVTFHDGSEMTAEDVKFSLERYASPDVQKYSYWSTLESVEVEGDHEVVITTEMPFAPLLSFLTGNSRSGGHIMPKGSSPEDLSTQPVGTGPYQFESYQEQSKIVLSKFDDYHVDGVPHVDTVEVPIIPEKSTAVSALRSGDVDMIDRVPSQTLDTLRKDGDISLPTIKGGLAFRCIMFNNTTEPFDDEKVRLAFAKGFRNKDIIDNVMNGEAVNATGPIPTSHEMYSELPHHQKYDPERSLELIEESSYSLSEIQGMDLEMLTWGSGFWYQFAKIAATQIGATLDTEFTVTSIPYQKAFTQVDELSYDMISWGWKGLTAADSYVYQYHEDGGRNKYRGYSNDRVNELADKARSTFDPDEQREIYKEAQDIIARTAADAFIFHPNLYIAHQNSVSGFEITPQSEYIGQLVDVKKS